MGGANRIIYGPDYLMQKNVVLVTINYRVGPQGIISSNQIGRYKKVEPLVLSQKSKVMCLHYTAEFIR